MDSQQTIFDVPAVETRTLSHRGQTITLYRIVHSFHGSFWGWCVGTMKQAATYRHYVVALDCARAYVESQVAS